MSTYFNETFHNDKGYCHEKHKQSLFMVKEIGGNDYNYVLFQSKTLEEVEAMVPDVVQAIVLPLQRVIENGACKLIVPGNFPIGCFPIHHTVFQTNDSTAYDELHCLKGLNNFSMYHNERLQQAIQELKPQHPDIAIVYGDYNNAYLWLLCHAHLLCKISTSWPTLFFLLFFLSFFLISFLSFFLLSTPCNTHIFKACKFNTIYQLGDSISDTGNLIRESPQSPFARLPYCRHLWQGFPMEKPKTIIIPTQYHPSIVHEQGSGETKTIIIPARISPVNSAEQGCLRARRVLWEEGGGGGWVEHLAITICLVDKRKLRTINI
ncbi:hypothetical protein Pint_19652 [Pistacia integerrima]|uniref:Uncharacterized protein n=1 Tax=Pistacia integerrima TaxID=434235 RepID=A0ACC0X959_9ROSI|nr:hypothetical protein Pint_19652 [Pistacia integerrima]